MIWTAAHFESERNSSFVMPFDDGSSVILRLVEVMPLVVREYPGSRRNPFFLLFHNAGDWFLKEATYRLLHPALGALELHLVPVHHDTSGQTLQAAFG